MSLGSSPGFTICWRYCFRVKGEGCVLVPVNGSTWETSEDFRQPLTLQMTWSGNYSSLKVLCDNWWSGISKFLSFTSYQNCSCFVSHFKVPGKLLLKSTFGSVKAIPGAAVKSILTLEGCTLLLVFPQYIDNYSIVLQKKCGVVGFCFVFLDLFFFFFLARSNFWLLPSYLLHASEKEFLNANAVLCRFGLIEMFTICLLASSYQWICSILVCFFAFSLLKI